MGYLWIWMSIKVLGKKKKRKRNPTFGGFIIWGRAHRIRLTFNCLRVHRKAESQRAPPQRLKKLSTNGGENERFSNHFFMRLERGDAQDCVMCFGLYFILFSPVIVIARLNCCYYVGGAGCEPAWWNFKKRRKKKSGGWKWENGGGGATAGRRAHFGLLVCRLRLYYFYYSFG